MKLVAQSGVEQAVLGVASGVVMQTVLDLELVGERLLWVRVSSWICLQVFPSVNAIAGCCGAL